VEGADVSRRDTESAEGVILARVREALQLPAPPPHLRSHDADPARPGALPIVPAEAGRPWLPDGGETPEEQRRILADNLARLRAEFVHVADTAAAAAFIAGRARERDWRRLAVHADPLVAAATATVGCATHRVDEGPFDKQALEGCDAGVTACESLVAQTGSVLVSSATCGGRSLSVLPHVHVVVATAEQVVGTLADAFARARARHGGRLPSMLSFITGPSRTGDIERILVLGAHGPKELVVILVG
jgi:L-lactate dehydrogenase complex protein LldG